MNKLDDIKARLARFPRDITVAAMIEALLADEYGVWVLDAFAHAPEDLAYLIGEVERLQKRMDKFTRLVPTTALAIDDSQALEAHNDQ